MPTKKQARAAASASLLAALALAGCLNQADTKKMDAATAQLFARMQAGQYADIYADAAPELTGTISQDGFVGFMKQIDAGYGACQTPVKQMNFHVNATTSGYFSTQGYTARCAKGPKQLSVTMVLRQGAVKLVGLHIGADAGASNSGE